MHHSPNSLPESALTRRTGWYEPLMGTAVEIQVTIDGPDRKDEADSLLDIIVDEMSRLQGIFSSVDPESEFSHWLRDEVDVPSRELSALLTEAAKWQHDSEGRFNPQVAVLSKLWSESEALDTPPSVDELREIATSIAQLQWFRDSTTNEWRPGAATVCTLNAIAKGWVVDSAISFAREHLLFRSLTINAGGDVRRSGTDPLLIGIENPFRPFDNEPPVSVVRILDCALATSGTARKGFLIGPNRFGHVIDPRTGWPVSDSASISVVAPTAADADVLATILGVETPTRAIAEAQHNQIPVFIITADQQQLRSDAWSALEIAIGDS